MDIIYRIYQTAKQPAVAMDLKFDYDDAFSVSEYAIPAFQWACGAGVINGTTESTLSPLGTATRAQFAVMLQRFCEKVVE